MLYNSLQCDILATIIFLIMQFYQSTTLQYDNIYFLSISLALVPICKRLTDQVSKVLPVNRMQSEVTFTSMYWHET